MEGICRVPSIAAILQRNSEGGAEYDKAKPLITMTDPEYDIPMSAVTRQILQAIFVVILAIVAGALLKWPALYFIMKTPFFYLGSIGFGSFVAFVSLNHQFFRSWVV